MAALFVTAICAFVCGFYIYERNGYGDYEISINAGPDEVLQWGAVVFPALWLILWVTAFVLIRRLAFRLLISFPVSMYWVRPWVFLVYSALECSFHTPCGLLPTPQAPGAIR
jgi:hypothetical protein